jgi:hypothetical protein
MRRRYLLQRARAAAASNALSRRRAVAVFIAALIR